jgi:two-component system, cell cycle response regulator CpdR
MPPRIMVVDDDDATRMILSRLLVSEGHAVDTFPCGEDALARLHTATYDVLITDLVMPGMDGLALAAAAKVVQAQLRCLVVTGRAPVVGAPSHVTWLSKPLDIDALLAALVVPPPAAATPVA